MSGNLGHFGLNAGQSFGPQGSVGAQGSQGPVGLQGPQGNQGLQGLQGLTGPQGFQGNQGWQGLQGLQGVQGPQGWQGLQGNQGLVGLQGTQGLQGFQGRQGFQGNQGLTGFQGAQGIQGLQGPQGNQGFQGNQGNQGAVGAQGNQGNQGFLSDISCRIKTGASSVPNTTAQVVSFTGEDWDTASFHDNSTNPSRITFATAGKYFIWANLEYTNGAANGNFKYEVWKNGSVVLETYLTRTLVASGQGNNIVSIELEFAANDYIEFVVTNNSGATLTYAASTAGARKMA